MSQSPKEEASEEARLEELENFEDSEEEMEIASGWKVPPIMGMANLNTLLQGQEKLEKTRIRTEIFSDTIREHKIITRWDVMNKHGSTLSKVGRFSSYRDQISLLPAVLEIKREEYQVLDRECRDRLGIFLQVYHPQRADWVAETTEQTTFECYTDQTRELSRPVSEDLTLLPNRLQRIADFLKDPDLTAREKTSLSKLVQVEANRASELVGMVCKFLQPDSSQTEGVGFMDRQAYQSLQETQKRVDQTALSMAHQLQQMRNQESQYRRLFNDMARQWRDSADQVTERLSTIADKVKGSVDMADQDHYRLLIELEKTCSERTDDAERLTTVMNTMNKVLQERTPESTPIKKRLRSATSVNSEEELSDITEYLSPKRPNKRVKHRAAK